MTKLEVELYTAMKVSKNDKALKNNIIDVLIMFESNETKKEFLKTLKEA